MKRTSKRIGYWFEESKEYSVISEDRIAKRDNISNFER